DVYSTSISGRLLAKIYNNHKSRLLEGNVRSYLKRTQKVNSGIVRTLQTIPSEFVAYNNGLSTVASLDGSVIKSLKGDFVEIEALNQLQIVNGGQTTVTIFECSRDPIDLSEVVVPMKLTVLKRRENEAEMVSNISRYANTQTAIAKSDLSSNEPFYKEMQKFSRAVPCYKDNIVAPINEYYWFFERSNGQYNTERRVIYNYSKSFSKRYPEKLKFSKKILAKAIMAYERKPDVVCLGNEKNFVEFNEYVIENSIIPNEEYFKKFIAILILWRSADKIILKDKLPIKAAVLPYTIAKLSYHSMKMINLSKIWTEQKIDSNLEFLILDIARQVSKYFQSVLTEHPNTLMWGRKPECWEAIKKIPYTIAKIDTEQAFEFMPSNPVIKFIEKKENLNNYSLWNRVLIWNSKNKVLSSQQEKYIQDAMMDIRYGMRISTVVKERKVKELFLKAVRNGFPYRD
ncbi:MAG: AIPR family protein, partial [Bacilli bacterium]|nr:AIPR family protein [Bacilli bacterium]